MRVTGFDLKKSTNDKTKAFGRIIIEDIFQVDVTIMDGKNGMFVSFPSKKGSDGKWYPTFKILDRAVSDRIQDEVIMYYEKNIQNL